MRISPYILPLLASAIPATSAGAASAAEPILVTANRVPQALGSIGQSVTLIDQAEIERRQSISVAEVLRTVPGVSIARNGGMGGVASVFIRGAESEQTVALIDGVKLNDPASPGGGFNFGNLLIGNIERIEVVRGPQSMLWGSQAIGGVVNMISRQPTDKLTINARGEGGYRGTVQLVGNVSGKAGPLAASAGAGWFRTDGISAFNEARGGSERDGTENFRANGSLTLALSNALSVEARGWYSDSKADQDGFAPPSFAFDDTAETSRTRETVAYTGLNAALFDGRFRNRLGFAYTDTNRSNDDEGFETFASTGQNERFEYQGVLAVAEGWQATVGLERETSHYSATSFGGPEASGRARIDSIYGQLVATPVEGLTLTGGVRHDDHDRFGGATTFGASGAWNLKSSTTVRGSYSEGFKAPSLFQLLSDFGNQSLQPETSQGFDLGISQLALGGALEATATYFQRTSTNLIGFVSCSPPLTGICVDRPFGTYDNVGRVRANGVELSLTLRPIPTLQFQANYTYTKAENRTEGDSNFDNALARRPNHSISTLIDYRWRFGLETGATLTHVSDSYENASNSRKLQGYVLVDLRASYPLTNRIALTGRIENLFDEEYETAFRYGQPGRAGYAGVRLSY